MADVEKVKAFFEKDIFAMNMGIEIIKADEEESICAFDITPAHFNAGNTVQGGAIFTLADLAFAVAANCGGRHTVSQSASITFIKPGTGKRLMATARKVSAGSKTCCYTVLVTNDEGKTVAHLTINGFVVGEMKL